MPRTESEGTYFAITGTLPILREEAVARLEQLGWAYQRCVTRRTDYLIRGDLKAKSKKLTRAMELREAGKGPELLSFNDVF